MSLRSLRPLRLNSLGFQVVYEGNPVGVGELFGAGGRLDLALENRAELLAAVLECLFRDLAEARAPVGGERVVAVVSREAHHGGTDFGTRPEAGCLDGTHELHIVVELHPHAREAARLRAGTGREAFCDFRLDEDDDRFRRACRALGEFKENARAGLVGKVRDEGGEAVAGTVLDEVERVAGADGEVGRVAERLGEAFGENGVFFDGGHREAAAEHFLGEHAEAGADFQHGRAGGKGCGVHNRLKGVAVDEEILPQHLVRVEAVFNAPRLDLAGACQVHHLSSGKG